MQLVQGETLALATDDLEGWVERFSRFPAVQVIDLDAARQSGDNGVLVAAICRRLPCRVGGGIRSMDRAKALLDSGADKIILGSALFIDGRPNLEFARMLADAFGRERLVAAVDARGGRVVVNGWRTALEVSPVEAIAALEPFFDEFLFTNVDVEGLMQGIDRGAIESVARATTRKLTVAGGVTTQSDVDWLDKAGIDAVVGMAIYTGRLKI